MVLMILIKVQSGFFFNFFLKVFASHGFMAISIKWKALLHFGSLFPF